MAATEQRTLASQTNFLCELKEGWTVYNIKCSTHQETHRNTLGVHLHTPGCIFPCFWQKKSRKCTLGAPIPFLVSLHAPCDVTGMKTMHLVVGHILIYILSKFEVNWTNSSQDTAILYPPPVLLIWPLSDHWRHGLRTNPTAAYHPVCPGHSWCHH